MVLNLSSKMTLAFALAVGGPIIGVAASAARHETRLDEADKRDALHVDALRRDRELLLAIRTDAAAVKARVDIILRIVAGTVGPPKYLATPLDPDQE